MGGDHFSVGGLSRETQTAAGFIFSARLRSFEAPPLRNPLSVEDVVPYELRALAAVPALVETVLELRALRTLLDLLRTDGIEGTGTASHDEGPLELA